MKCPICENQLAADVLRCTRCNSPLTVWKNLDGFAEQAYRAGLFFVERGRRADALEMLGRAITFEAGKASYWECYGRLLAQSQRYVESQAALEKAIQLGAGETAAQALANVQAIKAEVDSKSESQRPLLKIDFQLESTTIEEPWETCLAIEKDWQAFAPFAGMLNWPASDNTLQAAISHGGWSYVKGLEAYVARRDSDALLFFQQCVSDGCRVANPFIYILLLTPPAQLENAMGVLTESSLAMPELVGIIGAAAKVKTADHREVIPYLLLMAIQLRSEDREDLARRLIGAIQTPEQVTLTIETLRESLSHEPSEEIQLLLGDLYFQLKRLPEAKDAYEEAAKQFPAGWKPAIRLGNYYDKVDREVAIRYLSQALENDHEREGHVELLKMRLRMYIEREDWEVACGDAAALVRLCPGVKDFATILEQCQEKVEELTSSEADLEGHASVEGAGDESENDSPDVQTTPEDATTTEQAAKDAIYAEAGEEAGVSSQGDTPVESDSNDNDEDSENGSGSALKQT